MRKIAEKALYQIQANREAFCFLALLLFYLFLELSWLKTWEFSSDDALALLNSIQFIQGPRAWLSIPSSLGIPHSSIVYGIYACFYWLFPKIISIQLCVIYFLFICHGTLIKLAELFLPKPFSYLCSILFFFSPVFALFYFQRFWEPAILPAFTILALSSLLHFVKTEHYLSLWLTVICISVAISCHQLAAILYIPIGLILFIFPPKKVSPVPVVLILATALLGLSPWLYWLYLSHAWVIYIFPHLLLLLYLQKKFSPVKRDISKYIFYFLFVLLLGIILRNGLVGFTHAVEVLVDLISANSLYWPRHAGWISFESGTAWFFPEAALLAIYFYRTGTHFSSLEKLEKCLFIWIASSIFFFLLASSFLTSISHQWAIFLFPAAWIAIVKQISDLFTSKITSYRHLSLALALSLVFPAIFHTLHWERALKQKDGTGWHGPSLGVKENIITLIWSQPDWPLVSLASNKGSAIHDFYAWSFLNQKAAEASNSNSSGAFSFWYIHTKGALQEDNSIDKTLQEKCSINAEVGFVVLFRCKEDLKIGTRI